MMKSRDKGQAVGEKYSGMNILQASGKILASRFLQGGNPVPNPAFGSTSG